MSNVLRAAGVLLLGLGLVSCATGGDGAIVGTGDDGGAAEADAAADASSDASTAGYADAPALDATMGNETGAPEAAAPHEAGAVDGASPRDASGADAAGTDTGAPPQGDASSCPAAGFTGTLVTFDLASEPGNEASAPATATAAGVTAAALSRAPVVGSNPALTPIGGSGSINASNWPVNTSAPDPFRYYTFTVTPASGCSVALASLALDVLASATGPGTVEVATSADGFTAHASVGGTSSSTLPLSDPGSSGPIEIRVYGFGGASAGGTLRIQNTLTLSGALN